MLVRKLLLIVIAAGGLATSWAQVPADADPADTHARAIELLRGGDHETATLMLRDLYTQQPDSALYLHDYIVALAWTQQDAVALELEPQLDPETTPVYVIDAIARSARNAGARDVAVKWYLRAIELAPEELDYRVGLALTHAEAGEYAEADAVFAALPREERSSTTVLGSPGLHSAPGRPVRARTAGL